MSDLNQLLRRAVALPGFDARAAQRPMVPSDRTLAPPPADARVGAVLLLFYERGDDLHLVFARRPASMKDHPGQVAFPGGRQEPGETLAETALRETEEELGIFAERIDLLGELNPVYVPPSNFLVHPFVGWHAGQPRFLPSAREVAEVIEAPARHFQIEGNRQVETWEFEGERYRIPFYTFGRHKVWGATATILAEMIGRLRAIEGETHAK